MLRNISLINKEFIIKIQSGVPFPSLASALPQLFRYTALFFKAVQARGLSPLNRNENQHKLLKNHIRGEVRLWALGQRSGALSYYSGGVKQGQSCRKNHVYPGASGGVSVRSQSTENCDSGDS